jgi:hypothetical protein
LFNLIIYLGFALFEAVETLEVAGIPRGEWKTADGGATATTGPVAGYFWLFS